MNEGEVATMPTPDLPLAGIRVIDVAEHGFVPTAATVLAEYGADVIKVERLDGDPNRKIIPSGMVQTRDGIDYLAEIFNRNKRDIALDITTDAGQSVLARLIASADVFVTNQLPQVQRKLHTTRDEVMAINPRIVYARGHGYGQRGPDMELGSYDSVAYWSRGGPGHVLPRSSSITSRPPSGALPQGSASTRQRFSPRSATRPPRSPSSSRARRSSWRPGNNGSQHRTGRSSRSSLSPPPSLYS
jgi:hypothetical protein